MNPIFFYKTVSANSLASMECTQYALVTASTYEFVFVFKKGDFACGDGDRKVFQCIREDEGLCYKTNPNTDI
jgi:hypothetical protein